MPEFSHYEPSVCQEAVLELKELEPLPNLSNEPTMSEGDKSDEGKLVFKIIKVDRKTNKEIVLTKSR